MLKATPDVPPIHLSPNLLTNQSPNFSNILPPNLLPNPCKNAHPISSPNTTQSLTLPPPQILTQPLTQPLTHPLTQQLWLTWNYSIWPILFPLDPNWPPLDLTQPHLILNLTPLFATWPSFTQCDIPCTYLTQSDSTWTVHGLLNPYQKFRNFFSGHRSSLPAHWQPLTTLNHLIPPCPAILHLTHSDLNWPHMTPTGSLLVPPDPSWPDPG